MAGIKRFLAKAGKGALAGGLGIGGTSLPTDKIIDAIKEALADDEVAERLAQIVAAGLLMAAEGEDDAPPPQ